mmetsp:Transcript_14333/g.41786  ORF Transcript_14333/g.41786 Transcript_14333/m.41786 type:complete len:242 (-) Transcript_14333:160-885(-)|eukprot:323597-Chlamydomonas_euryale.AAC.1
MQCSDVLAGHPARQRGLLVHGTEAGVTSQEKTRCVCTCERCSEALLVTVFGLWGVVPACTYVMVWGHPGCPTRAGGTTHGQLADRVPLHVGWLRETLAWPGSRQCMNDRRGCMHGSANSLPTLCNCMSARCMLAGRGDGRVDFIRQPRCFLFLRCVPICHRQAAAVFFCFCDAPQPVIDRQPRCFLVSNLSERALCSWLANCQPVYKPATLYPPPILTMFLFLQGISTSTHVCLVAGMSGF